MNPHVMVTRSKPTKFNIIMKTNITDVSASLPRLISRLLFFFLFGQSLS